MWATPAHRVQPAPRVQRVLRGQQDRKETTVTPDPKARLDPLALPVLKASQANKARSGRRGLLERMARQALREQLVHKDLRAK